MSSGKCFAASSWMAQAPARGAQTLLPRKTRRASESQGLRSVASSAVPLQNGWSIQNALSAGATCASLPRPVHPSGGHFKPSTHRTHRCMITFRWRDSAHKDKKRLMTLPAGEFLRRFLLQVLPPGFVRIRHFGFLAHRRRRASLPLCLQLLAGSGRVPNAPKSEEETGSSPRPLWTCPHCGGPMVLIERLSNIQLRLRSPPVPIAHQP
jgi:hypothetical protein